MKKFLFIFASALLSFNVAVGATEIEIESAVKDSDGYVNMSCGISDEVDEQLITITAREYSKSNDDVDGIIYIDEIEPEITDGEFEYKFNVASKFDTKTVYLLRVGGTDVETPAQKIIAVDGEEVYVLGDVNGDGYIDDTDATLVLKYISGTGELSKTELLSANAVADTVVNMLDVIKIIAMNNRILG